MAPKYTFTDGSTLKVGTIYCVGQNYAKHVKEMGSSIPESPVIFIKPPSAYIPDGGIIKPPSISKLVHHEVELVIIIGKDCGNISGKDAVKYIAGVAVGIDVTLRDLQNKAKQKGEPWAVAKGFATSAPISPVVPITQVKNMMNITLELKVNGETKQKDSTSQMIRTPESLIEYLSNIFTLKKGDCIFTGTPDGVGEIKSGDKLYAELKGLTKLKVSVE
jgi:acylpyruvate hydrolase